MICLTVVVGEQLLTHFPIEREELPGIYIANWNNERLILKPDGSFIQEDVDSATSTHTNTGTWDLAMFDRTRQIRCNHYLISFADRMAGLGFKQGQPTDYLFSVERGLSAIPRLVVNRIAGGRRDAPLQLIVSSDDGIYYRRLLSSSR